MASAVKHFAPSRLQVAYCFVLAILISMYWLRERFVYLLTSSTQTTSSELHASFTQTLNQATNNSVASFMSLAVFWALVGLIVMAFMFESLSIFTEVRNDYIIATTYTGGEKFERGLIRVLAFKALLAIGCLIFLVVSWQLFGTWHGLIVQPSHGFFSPQAMVKELFGLAGLVINLYLGWMLSLFFAPRFFSRWS